MPASLTTEHESNFSYVVVIIIAVIAVIVVVVLIVIGFFVHEHGTSTGISYPPATTWGRRAVAHNAPRRCNNHDRILARCISAHC